jgi:tetratricopeptide (TPR) repeat protein
MSLLESMSRLFTKGGKAATLQQRGMAKAKREDWSGAIDDYTAAIDFPQAPHEVKAMAYFNRALAYAHLGRHANAEEDLQALLATPGAPEHIRSAAKEKLARWGKRRGKPV